MSDIRRETKETKVRVRLTKGAGGLAGEAGEPFLTHMVNTLARYAGLNVELDASGDGMYHHLAEDVAITLGRALRAEIDERAVTRFGHAVVPMDDALVLAAVDLVERPFFAADLEDDDWQHFLRSLAFEGRFTLHVQVLRGHDPHHVVECAFKAIGLALRQALAPRREALSTKGVPRVRGLPARR